MLYSFIDSDFCKMLESSMEMKEFKVFRELRNNIAMDLGNVKPAQNNTVSSTSHCAATLYHFRTIF